MLKSGEFDFQLGKETAFCKTYIILIKIMSLFSDFHLGLSCLCNSFGHIN